MATVPAVQTPVRTAPTVTDAPMEAPAGAAPADVSGPLPAAPLSVPGTVPGAAESGPLPTGAPVAQQPPERELSQDGSPLPTKEKDNGPLRAAYDLIMNNGGLAAIEKGNDNTAIGVLKALDKVADLVCAGSARLLKIEGAPDEAIARWSLTKPRILEHLIAALDEHIKNSPDKVIDPNDDGASIVTALTEALGDVTLGKLTKGISLFAKADIESTHQSVLGVQPGEKATLGNLQTNNPVDALEIDTANAVFKKSLSDAINECAEKYAGKGVGSFLISLGGKVMAKDLSLENILQGKSSIADKASEAAKRFYSTPGDPEAQLEWAQTHD